MRVRSSLFVLFILVASITPSYAASRSSKPGSTVQQIVQRLRNLLPKTLGDLLSPPHPRKATDCGVNCG